MKPPKTKTQNKNMDNNKKYIPKWVYAKELHDKMLKGWEEAAKAPHEPRRPRILTEDEKLVQKYGYLVWMDNPEKRGEVKLKEVLYELHLISYEELLSYPDGKPFFDFHKIPNAEICPYCYKEPKIIDNTEIHGKSYNVIYYCEPCDAWTGCHKGTRKPLGKLMNKELHHYRSVAQECFDKICKKAITKGKTKKQARSSVYVWLAESMNIKIESLDINVFGIDDYKRVVELCKPYIKSINKQS